MRMDPINAIAYVTDNDPTDLVARTPATWYVDENQEAVPPENIGWMQAQGWVLNGQNVTDGVIVSYRMTRRRVNPERLLADLITDYTAAYNEGRDLNDTRYDDIVALYCVMLSKGQAEIISAQISDDVFYNLVDTLIASITNDYTYYAADVTGSLATYGASIRSQIGTRFDSQLSSARQDLVSRGMYNSTIWDTVAAGIERERALALSDVEDKIVQQQLSLKHKVYAEKTQMRDRVLAARDKLRDTLWNAWDRQLAVRNTILQAMMNFMERRTDAYPDVKEVGRLAANLGAGNPTAFLPTPQ